MQWKRQRGFGPARYRLGPRIARGGQGELYTATCKVVIKRLIRIDEPLHHERMRREFEAARQIDHPNVVKVLDGSFGAEPYIVMEYLRGEPLSKRLARSLQRKRPLECIPFLLQAVRGVEELHAKGLIHRDLKPENIFIRDDLEEEIAVVLDLGAVRFLTRSRQRSQTTTGMLIGTPGYMAPEQVAGLAVTETADVYALGVIVHEMLVGALPEGSSESSVSAALQSAVMQIDSLPTWSSGRDLDGVRTQLVDVVQKALAREVTDRYPSAAAFRLAIERAVGIAESTYSPAAVGSAAKTTPPGRWIQPRPAHNRSWAVAALVAVIGVSVSWQVLRARMQTEAVEQQTPAMLSQAVAEVSESVLPSGQPEANATAAQLAQNEPERETMQSQAVANVSESVLPPRQPEPTAAAVEPAKNGPGGATKPRPEKPRKTPTKASDAEDEVWERIKKGLASTGSEAPNRPSSSALRDERPLEHRAVIAHRKP